MEIQETHNKLLSWYKKPYKKNDREHLVEEYREIIQPKMKEYNITYLPSKLADELDAKLREINMFVEELDEVTFIAISVAIRKDRPQHEWR